MDPLPAAPPARGIRQGGSAPRATTPSGPAPSLPPHRGPQRSGPGRVPGALQPRVHWGPSPSRSAHRLSGPGSPPAAARGRLGTCGGRPRSLLSAAPGTHFLAGACVLRPSSRPPARRLPVLCRRRPLRRTSSRRRRRRVRSPPPPPPHHVPHPRLRHRETRSPAGVGRRPAACRSAPATGPECRPEAGTRHDTLPAGPPRPPGPGASSQGPGFATLSQRLGTPLGIREPTGPR